MAAAGERAAATGELSGSGRKIGGRRVSQHLSEVPGSSTTTHSIEQSHMRGQNAQLQHLMTRNGNTPAGTALKFTTNQ